MREDLKRYEEGGDSSFQSSIFRDRLKKEKRKKKAFCIFPYKDQEVYCFKEHKMINFLLSSSYSDFVSKIL